MRKVCVRVCAQQRSRHSSVPHHHHYPPFPPSHTTPYPPTNLPTHTGTAFYYYDPLTRRTSWIEPDNIKGWQQAESTRAPAAAEEMGGGQIASRPSATRSAPGLKRSPSLPLRRQYWPNDDDDVEDDDETYNSDDEDDEGYDVDDEGQSTGQASASASGGSEEGGGGHGTLSGDSDVRAAEQEAIRQANLRMYNLQKHQQARLALGSPAAANKAAGEAGMGMAGGGGGGMGGAASASRAKALAVATAASASLSAASTQQACNSNTRSATCANACREPLLTTTSTASTAQS